MTDINSKNFIEDFDIAECTVGVVGYGYVGQAISAYFRDVCPVFVYDIAKPELGTLERVVGAAELIFVCVPTPMKDDGECYTGIIESALESVYKAADDAGRDWFSFIAVIKSTVPPGFTKRMQDKYLGARIMFSPEFLTEKNSTADMLQTNRIILGGDLEDGRVAFKFFEARWPKKVEEGRLMIVSCPPTTAEMVKLYANGMLMAKVLFSNEVFLICEKLKVSYNEVRSLACLDKRIGVGHTQVPGHDGQLGAGGHCFPKDINSLRHVAHELGTGEKILTAIIDRNNEIREDKDWLRMEGRAVIGGKKDEQ